jgi:hypothetical protein
LNTYRTSSRPVFLLLTGTQSLSSADHAEIGGWRHSNDDTDFGYLGQRLFAIAYALRKVTIQLISSSEGGAPHLSVRRSSSGGVGAMKTPERGDSLFHYSRFHVLFPTRLRKTTILFVSPCNPTCVSSLKSRANKPSTLRSHKNIKKRKSSKGNPPIVTFSPGFFTSDYSLPRHSATHTPDWYRSKETPATTYIRLRTAISQLGGGRRRGAIKKPRNHDKPHLHSKSTKTKNYGAYFTTNPSRPPVPQIRPTRFPRLLRQERRALY